MIMGDESSTMEKQPPSVPKNSSAKTGVNNTQSSTSTFSLTELLQRDRIETKLNLTIAAAVSSSLADPTPSLSAISSFSQEKKFDQFLDEVVLEQLQNAERLWSLNPSRRESLGKFLAELSKQPEPENPQDKLKEFIAQDRTPQAQEALKQLFKQIALAQLGKALLVKSWNPEKFSRADLKNLTSAIEKGMRTFVHLQTSTSQLIQRNFYSWYNLSAPHQDLLWSLIENASLEDPSLESAKDWVLCRARKLSAETLGERDRYSKLFYQFLWKSIQTHELIRPSNRNVFGFCPTLRDGCLMDQAPSHIEWIGFEPLSFELLFCEIRYLWNQPKSLPLWIKGNSLEMSMEQQSQLPLTHSGKQNILQQLEAISSCEIAMIAEESLIRTQSRTLAGQALRKQIDQHSVLKKVKQPQSTRGMYQACQAMEKLRQGGVLIWAREEVLDESSGKPALQFLLNQAKILFIADLSALQCTQDTIKRDLPKALYVLQKENDLEIRKGHRPLMIKTYGSIESSQDVQLLFDRIFSLLKKPEQSFPHEPFQIHSRISPIEQREWEQHWFNPADDQMVDQIETLKKSSKPLGELAIVRMLSWADLGKTAEKSEQKSATTGAPPHFFMWSELGDRGNEIFISEEAGLPNASTKKGNIFVIYPQEINWSVPLQSLIRSQLTRDWLNYSAERKKGGWSLKEADIKSIPIPKHIYLHFKTSQVGTLNSVETKLSNFGQKLISLVPSRPGEALTLMENNKIEAETLKAQIFTLAAQVLHQQKKEQSTLFSLVRHDGQIQQQTLEKVVLQESDLCRVDQHPLIRFTPTLAEHQAIHHVTQVQHPSPGVLLATSKGLTQFLHIQDSWLRDRLLEKIAILKTYLTEPTWKELCSEIKVPKNPDQTKLITLQIVKAYHEEKMRKKELVHLLGACLIENSEHSSPAKIGLLQ